MWPFAVALVAGCWLGPAGWSQALWVTPFAVMMAWTQRSRLRAAILLALAGYCYGIAALDDGLNARLPVSADGDDYRIRGTIVGLPEHQRLARGRQAGRCYRRLLLVPGSGSSVPMSGRIKLSLYDRCIELRPGDRVTVRARLYRPRARVNRGGFDSARQALADNRGARGYVRDWIEHESAPGGMDGLRWRLSERIRGILSDHSRAARFLPALVTGDRRHLEDGDWRLLRRTGTAHLVAISGLHITLVTGLTWGLFRLVPPLLWRRWSPLAAQQFAVVPALVVAVGSAALAGFSLPTQRALVMTAVVLLALSLRRELPRVRVLGLALTVVLLWQPLSCLAPGFWLSFGAVGLLSLMAGRGAAALVRAQALLSLGLGAVTGWLFGGWGLAAPVANLVLIPLFSTVLVPLALLGTLVDPSGGLLTLAAAVLEPVMTAVAWLARVTPSLPVPPGPVSALLTALAAVVVLAPAPVLPRWSAPFLLLPWLWPPTPAPEPGGFHLTVFDVGQGQAVAVRTRNRVLLYDMGPGWPGGNTGGTLLLPWLNKERAPVELTFASHGDGDHAGGWSGLRRRLPESTVFSGEPDRVPGARPCRRGQSWRFDGVGVEVLWPDPRIRIRDSNNRSCVVRIEGRHGSVLLTGDIQKPVEYWLAERGGLDSDIVQVPHHGSRSSSSYTFLRAVDAEQAFVSAGYHNAFGHPAESVTRRYRELGIRLYNNARTGMIVFRRDEQHNAAPVLWRAEAPRPWRAPLPVEMRSGREAETDMVE